MVNLGKEAKMMRTLKLPEKTYTALEKAAYRSGTSIADWIAGHLSETDGESDSEPTEVEIESANARLDSCIVNYGRALGTDNEDIDADLARAYDSASV
jgi:hypothetical protein